MIKEYLRYIWRTAHDQEYRFFSNFNDRTGIAVLVGYNEGKNLTSYRYFNRSDRIVQFEKDSLLEPRIKAMGGIAGKNFEYFIVKLGKNQMAQTVFVSQAGYKRKTEAAAFESAILRQDKAFSAAEPEKDGGGTDLLKRRARAAQEVDQIVVETKPFDSYGINAGVIIIDSAEFTIDAIEGMRNSLIQSKPMLMLPNQWPVIAEVNQYLAGLGYQGCIYSPKKNSIRPVREKENSRNVFFIHRQVIEVEKETGLGS